MARLKEQYVNEIAPALNKKFGYKSVMQIPKLDKVIINVAAGEAKENAKVIDAIVADLGQITGQKAIVCKARKSVANFKLREGMVYIVRFLCDVPYRKSSAFRTQHIEIRKKRAIMFKIRSACPREVFWMSAQLWTKSGGTCCTIDKLPH